MDPYRSQAFLAKAFADPSRLFILERLAQGPCSVDELASRTSLVLGNLSHHLQILKNTSLVKASRKGRQIIYSLTGAQVVKVYQSLHELQILMERQDDSPVKKGSLSDGEKISREAALKHLKKGSAVLLDVRPREEFDAGHIRGAVHIPLEELESRLLELPADKLIIVYCRGPYCQLSSKASILLDGKNRPNTSLDCGYPEWWAFGLPVESLTEIG